MSATSGDPGYATGPDPDFDFDFDDNDQVSNNDNDNDYVSDLDEETPLHNVSFPTHTTTQDLKTQLSQLQQKLNFANDDNDDDQFGNYVVDDNVSDMSFDISELTNERALSHNDPVPLHEPDRSVDFLGDLSDGLLMESRKLSYENKQFKKQIKQLLEDCDNKDIEISNLSELNNQLSIKEEEQVEQLWKLESELKNFKSALDVTKTDLVKFQEENSKSSILVESLKNTIEQLKNEKTQIEESSEKTILKLNSQIQELKDSNENLNEENDVLHKNIVQLNETVDNLKTEIQTKHETPIEEAASFSEFDDSILQDPLPTFMSKDATQLDSETLHKNLKTSYQQMMKLKNQNMKMKTELLRLKHASPTGKKVINISNKENDNVLGNISQSSWTNYKDDSFMKGTNINLNSGLESVLSGAHTEKDDADDLDLELDLDSDLSFDPSQMEESSPVKRRKLSLNLSKPLYMLIVPQTTLETVDDDKFELEQLDFSKYKTIPVPTSLTNQIMNVAVKDANEFSTAENLQLLSKNKVHELSDEIEMLKKNNENPSLEYLRTKSKEAKHLLISDEEHDSLIASIEDKKEKIAKLEDLQTVQDETISSLREELDSKSATLEEQKSKISELQSTIDAPSREYIVDKAHLLNMIAVETSKYEDILGRVEKLQETITASDASLSSLKANLDTLKCEKKALEEQIESPKLDYLHNKAKSVNYVVIPLSEQHAASAKTTKLESELVERDQKIAMILDTNSELENTVKEFETKISDTEVKIHELNERIALLTDEKTSLEKNISSPAIEYLQEKAGAFDHIVVTQSSYNGLTEQIVSLEKEIKLKEENIVSVTDDLKSCQAEIVDVNEQLNQAKKEIESSKLTIASLIEDKNQLQDSVTNPSLEYLYEKTTAANHVILPLNEHTDLVEKIPALKSKLEQKDKDITDLNDVIGTSNAEVQKQEERIVELETNIVSLNTTMESLMNEKEQLEGKLQNPELGYLQEKATLSHMVLTPEAEHLEITSKIPILESQIQEKDSTISSLSEKTESLESKITHLEEELNSIKTASENLKVKLNDLQKSYDSPDLQYINQKCAELKIHPIPDIEFKKLNADIATRGEKISSLFDELEIIKSEKAELAKTNETANEKIEKLTAEMDKLRQEHQTLSSKYDSPDIDYIKSRVVKHNFVAIPVKEHQSLHQDLKDKSKEVENLMVLKDEITRQQTNIDELNLEKEKLIKEIDTLSGEMNEKNLHLLEISKQVDHPSVDYITSKSKLHNLVAVPVADLEMLKEEHQSSKKKLADSISQMKDKEKELDSLRVLKNDLSKQLEISGTTTVSLELHDSVQSELNETRQKLTAREEELSSLRKVELEIQNKNSEIADLKVENQRLMDVEKKMATLEADMIRLQNVEKDLGVKTNDLTLLKKQYTESQEEINKLKIKETELGKFVKENEQLNAQLKSPDFEYLSEKCKDMGHVPITIAESEMHKSNLKDLEAYKAKIHDLEAEIKKLQISNAEYTTLKSELEKSLSEHKAKLEEQSLKLSELTEKIENPDSAYIKSKSSVLGLITYPVSEHQANISKIDSLTTKSESLEAQVNKLAGEKSECQKQIKELLALQSTPSKDYIVSKSASLGIIPIPIIEHQSAQSEMKRKDILIKQHEKTIDNLKTLKSEFDNQNSVLVEATGKLKNLQQEHATLLEKFDVIKNTNVEKEAEVGVLSGKLSELENNYKQQLQNYEKLQKNVEDKNSQLSSLDLKLAESLKAHGEILEKMDNLEKTIKDKDSQIERLSNDLSKLNDTYDSPTVPYLQEKLAVHNHVSLKQTELSKLQDEKEQYALKAQELEISLKETSSRLNAVELEKADYVERLSQVEGQLHETTAKIDELETRLSESSTLIDMLKSSESQLKEKIVNIESDKLEITQKFEKIEEEKSTLQEKYDKLTGLNAAFIAESKKLTAEKEDLLAQKEELETSMNEKDAVLSAADVRNKELEENILSLKKDVEDKDKLIVETGDSLRNQINLLETSVKEKELKLNELEKLQKELSDKKSELNVTLEKLSDMERKYQSPSLDHLTSSLANYNYVPLPLPEHQEITRLNEEHLKHIEGLKASLFKANANLEKKSVELENALVELKNVKAQQAEELEILKSRSLDMQKSTSVATFTSENVHEIASQSTELLIPALRQQGYAVLSQEEYQRLLNPDAGIEQIANLTHEIEELESDLESKKSILEDLDARSSTSFISADDSIISTFVPVEDVLLEKAQNLKKKINELSESLTVLKEQKLALNKQINRLSVSSVDGAAKNLNSKISKKLTKVANEIEIKEVELKSQQNALAAVEAYANKAKDLELPPVETKSFKEKNDDVVQLEAEIKQLESKYQRKKEDFEVLKKDLGQYSDSALLAERLSMLGYYVELPDGKRFTVNHLRVNNKNLAQSELSKSKHFDAKTGTYNVDSLIKQQGWTLLTSEKSKVMYCFENINKIPFDDLKLKLKECGMVLLKNKEYSDLVNNSKQIQIPKQLTASQIHQYANKLNLTVLNDEEIDKIKKRSITSRDLAQKAKDLNLVLLSSEEVKKLKENDNLTPENIRAKASKMGMMCITQDKYVATTVSKTPDVSNVVVLSNSYYKLLSRSHTWYKKNKDLQSSTKTPTIEENESFDIRSFSPSTFQQPAGPNQTHLPGTDTDKVSLKSVGTVITEKDIIIKAVMKTVIGEFLYKYYRKLGPLTTISDTRHQRYFWIHPYSMTLYWSTANPVFSDPAKNQIKAVTILDVVSVEDNNPLPPGIYHKSLIIKSIDKSVRLTCPTRQIHNIWYNSLKYLLERNPKLLINDDNIENQYEQEFSIDKKLELERSHSQMIRQSRLQHSGMSARRSPSMLSVRGEPRSPGLRSKQTSTRSFASLRGHTS